MKTRIIAYKDYVAGWLDTTLHDFLRVVNPNEENFRWALITCLDSHPEPVQLLSRSPELKPLVRKARPLGSGILIPGSLLLRVDAGRQLFFGFDEVWFFPNANLAPKPSAVSIVGPGRIDSGKTKKLGKWMTQHSCSMGVGGGEGLNFILPVRGPARLVLGMSIDQPEPSFAPA